MGTFVPTTAAEREQMLRTIGASSVEELFRDVPQQMYLDGYLNPAAEVPPRSVQRGGPRLFRHHSGGSGRHHGSPCNGQQRMPILPKEDRGYG